MGFSLTIAPAGPAAPFLAPLLAAAANPPCSLGDHLAELPGLRETFRPAEALFREGETAEKIYHILDGTVRLCRHARDGRRSILAFLAAGDLTGFGENRHHLVSAEAVEDVTVMVYERAAFERLAAEDTLVRAAHLRRLSDDLAHAQRHMFVLGHQKAGERVASFLLRLAEKTHLSGGDRLNLPMSRQDIADHLGLTIETISRTITGLRGKGVIFIPASHQIILRDMRALQSMAAGSQG